MAPKNHLFRGLAMNYKILFWPIMETLKNKKK